MRISDWSSDVCSSDLRCGPRPLSALVFVKMCAAFQLLHQINDVLQINVVIDWLFRVFLVEGDLMKIPIIEKLLHRPDFGRQSPTDRMVDASEPLWRAGDRTTVVQGKSVKVSV